MQVRCFLKDYSLIGEVRYTEISRDLEAIATKLQISLEDIIGIGTFDSAHNVLHYGYIINIQKHIDLTELGMQDVIATLPDSGWTIYAGQTSDLPVLYEAISELQIIHSIMEFFYSNGTCKLYVQ